MEGVEGMRVSCFAHVELCCGKMKSVALLAATGPRRVTLKEETVGLSVFLDHCDPAPGNIRW
jgi:hypothetical protein